MANGDDRARVGIRELRQNLSIFVDRVKAGETLEVTEHGRPVAELGPLRRPSKSLYQQMVADGRILKARGELNLPRRQQQGEHDEALSQSLVRMRGEDRT